MAWSEILRAHVQHPCPDGTHPVATEATGARTASLSCWQWSCRWSGTAPGATGASQHYCPDGRGSAVNKAPLQIPQSVPALLAESRPLLRHHSTSSHWLINSLSNIGIQVALHG